MICTDYHIPVLYTIHCPKCNAIEAILKKKEIPFTIVDDKEKVLEVADFEGIKDMPFACIDNKYYNCKELQAWIKEQ